MLERPPDATTWPFTHDISFNPHILEEVVFFPPGDKGKLRPVNPESLCQGSSVREGGAGVCGPLSEFKVSTLFSRRVGGHAGARTSHPHPHRTPREDPSAGAGPSLTSLSEMFTLKDLLNGATGVTQVPSPATWAHLCHRGCAKRPGQGAA